LNENGGHSLVLTIVFEEYVILDRNTSITIKLNVEIMAWGWSSFDRQVKLYCPLLGAGIPMHEACLLSVMNEFIQIPFWNFRRSHLHFLHISHLHFLHMKFRDD
jgi:hypothetical protein